MRKSQEPKGSTFFPAEKAAARSEKERNLASEGRIGLEKGGNGAGEEPGMAQKPGDPLGCGFFVMGWARRCGLRGLFHHVAHFLKLVGGFSSQVGGFLSKVGSFLSQVGDPPR